MKKYSEIKQKHGDELNSFEGIFFAFSNEQFADGLKKMGIKPGEEREKLAKLPAGGFILKTRSKAFSDMFKRHNKEMEALKKDRKALLEAIVYELGNHEYGYTYDETDALEALGMEAGDVPEDILKKAKQQALALCAD